MFQNIGLRFWLPLLKALSLISSLSLFPITHFNLFYLYRIRLEDGEYGVVESRKHNSYG